MNFRLEEYKVLPPSSVVPQLSRLLPFFGRNWYEIPSIRTLKLRRDKRDKHSPYNINRWVTHSPKVVINSNHILIGHLYSSTFSYAYIIYSFLFLLLSLYEFILIPNLEGI